MEFHERTDGFLMELVAFIHGGVCVSRHGSLEKER